MFFSKWFGGKKEDPKQVIVRATVPLEPTIYMFTPLVNFHSDEFQSDYMIGYTYNVREGNRKLDRYVQKWIQEELVERIE